MIQVSKLLGHFVSSRLHHMMHHRGVAQAAILAVPHSVFNQIVLVPYRNVDYVRCRAEYPKFEFNFPFWLSVQVFWTDFPDMCQVKISRIKSLNHLNNRSSRK